MSYRRAGGILLMLVVALSPAGRAGGAGADALVDAKRKAAADLIRDGKTADAIALTLEVLKADPDNYRDHLLLARAYDKQNKQADAAEQYRRVLATLAPADDRAVRAEAERRLKVLDVQMIKIQAAEDEFLKKLDALERDAIAAKDAAAVRRVFRLKGGLYNATDRRDRRGFEVVAGMAWQDTGLTVTAGHAYRVRAVGTFHVKQGVDSTPEGTDALKANYQGPIGLLLGRVGDNQKLIQVGSTCRFMADNSGKLILLLNPQLDDKSSGSGAVTVLIEEESIR
jgi:tetratricopeptide (TPR) repeat protein